MNYKCAIEDYTMLTSLISSGRKRKNIELREYVTAINLKFKLQPRDNQDILQDIAIQVPSLHVPNFRKASEVGTQYHSNTKGCRNKGAYDDHGKLYIFRYPLHGWIDESIKPH